MYLHEAYEEATKAGALLKRERWPAESAFDPRGDTAVVFGNAIADDWQLVPPPAPVFQPGDAVEWELDDGTPMRGHLSEGSLQQPAPRRLHDCDSATFLVPEAALVHSVLTFPDWVRRILTAEREKATAVERERCAGIADDYKHHAGHSREIARRIREGGPP